MNLRHRADGRARVFGGGLLLDGDGGRQPVDLIDVGLLHHLQKLARIGGERLHIAALAFGVDGVEGERRFARAGQPREHDELVARNGEVDVLEIMLARAADGDCLVLTWASSNALSTAAAACFLLLAMSRELA